MARISTGLGDDGTTQRPGGGRVPKSDAMLDCVGDWDEVGCLLGLVATYDLPPTVRQPLESIRRHLFQLSASFYTPNRDMDSAILTELSASIDALEANLPPLRSFILPGGSIAAAQLHLARAVCRRAERSMSRVPEMSKRPIALAYANRLSDWLFLAARAVNAAASIPDTTIQLTSTEIPNENRK